VVDAPALAALQRAFFARVTGQRVAGAASPAALRRVVARGPSTSPALRLDVYRNMIRLRFREALDAIAPATAAAVGARRFGALADRYVAAHPSRSPSLRHLGAALPAFIAGDRRLPAAERAWLADLARLELARLDVFDAVDETTLTWEAMRAVAPEAFAALPLRLVAAHRLIDVDHAVDELVGPLLKSRDGARRPSLRTARARRPRTLLVWRQGTALRQRPVDAAERALLSLVADGAPAGLVCERAGDAQAAFALLGRWVADALLVAPAR
jgi:hypothetical protein